MTGQRPGDAAQQVDFTVRYSNRVRTWECAEAEAEAEGWENFTGVETSLAKAKPITILMNGTVIGHSFYVEYKCHDGLSMTSKFSQSASKSSSNKDGVILYCPQRKFHEE